MAETYRFYHTFQSEKESVLEYANKLKRQATTCDFGTFLQRADQFVGGVRNPHMKKKLLSEERTFQQAVDLARADELAQQESRQLVENKKTRNSKARGS